MNNQSLKSQATSGIIWNAMEKFSGQFIQLAVGIILARILVPADFGLIGMLSIFIAISGAFVGSGLGSGLIQKKNRTDVDYTTVFIFNVAISLLVYVILFFSAPLIADYYDEPRLTLLTRVLSLNIFINSFAIIQRTRLTVSMDFKSMAKVNVSAIIISGSFAVILALLDYGVWALVGQQLLNAVVAVTILWVINKGIPPIRFSMQSFRRLFGFGSKLLISRIYAQSLQNVYNITMGKYYSAGDLGYFTRAKTFSGMSSGLIAQVLQKVTYPLLSSIQDDKQRLVAVYSRMIKMAAFIVLPAMSLLALLADPLIRLLLGEKWLGAIVLLQWLAIARITYPISVINMNILNAVGRSDLFLKVDLIKAPIVIGALWITIPISVEAMVIGQLVTSVIAFFINAYLPGKLFGYGPLNQLKDMVPYFLMTLGMGISVFVVVCFIPYVVLKLVAGVVVGLLVYWALAEWKKVDELEEVKLVIEKIKNKIQR